MKSFEELAETRGYLCACGCGQPAHDRHHGLIIQITKKGKTKYPILDDERNLFLVNHHEHVNCKKFNTMEWTLFFWEQHCKLYGPEKMQEWRNAVPAKLQSRLDFIPKG
ncbi:MAG: hypothetical protein WC765_07155 [Phycisphaerae bacterium]|jgi:hypothetical protein